MEGVGVIVSVLYLLLSVAVNLKLLKKIYVHLNSNNNT